MPFGHADDLSIVLLDDFDPVHCMTADIPTTEEDGCLAFCPKIKDLVGDSASQGVLCDLHELFGEACSPAGNAGAADKARFAPEFQFQKSMPLLVSTKYKIGGLGALGEGVLFQNALYRAMAQRIRQVKEGLEDGANGLWKGWMKSGDLESTRIAMLDLQGGEEIGTLIFCRNYSVAMA